MTARTATATRLTAVAAAAMLSACAAPEFPRQAAYEWGLAGVIELEERAILAARDPQEAAARREALTAVELSRCPDWNRLRLPTPHDDFAVDRPPAGRPAFGCHVQASLDAMIADRRDVDAPRTAVGAATGASAARGVAAHRGAGGVRLPAASSVAPGG